MTKTLTEQWKNGKLKDGSFYIERLGKYMRANCIGTVLYLENHDVIWSPNIVEVLAPVPSYDEYKQLVSKTDKLEKKLAIATKALKEYAETETYDWVDSKMVAKRAIKKMEGVK